MHGYEIIEVVSINKNRDVKNWYDSNVGSLAQILSDKLKYESTLESERDNTVNNYRIDNSGKAVSK
jgi:ribosomal protein S13